MVDTIGGHSLLKGHFSDKTVFLQQKSASVAKVVCYFAKIAIFTFVDLSMAELTVQAPKEIKKCILTLQMT